MLSLGLLSSESLLFQLRFVLIDPATLLAHTALGAADWGEIRCGITTGTDSAQIMRRLGSVSLHRPLLPRFSSAMDVDVVRWGSADCREVLCASSPCTVSNQIFRSRADFFIFPWPL
jgi:hypothetical protein